MFPQAQIDALMRMRQPTPAWSPEDLNEVLAGPGGRRPGDEIVAPGTPGARQPAATAGEGWGIGGMGRFAAPPQMPPGPLRPSPGITPGPIPAAPIGPATESFMATTKGMGTATGVAPGAGQPEAAGDAGIGKGQQAAYQPKFVQTNPFTNLGYTATSPEEELMLNAQKAGFMNAANAFGTGIGPGGRETTAREWAAVAGRGADDFLRSTLMMRGQDQQKAMGEADLAQRGDLARMQMANQRGIAELEAASRNNPAALRNQALLQAMGALATGQMTPETMQSFMNFFDRQAGGGPAGAAPAADSADKAGGGPAAAVPTGPMGPDDLRSVGAPGRAAKVAESLLPMVQGKTADGSPVPFGPNEAAKVLDALGRENLSEPEMKALVGLVRQGKLGDPNVLNEMLAKATAAAYLKAQPPSSPGGNPIDFRADYIHPDAIPGLYSIPGGPGGKPLFELTTGGSAFGRAMNAAGQGIPYNRIRLPDGRLVPIDPDMLGVGPDKGAAPALFQGRAGVGSQLLPLLYGPR